MAEISLHALMRHQNHLKIKINPVPAPKVRSMSKICKALCNKRAKAALKIIRPMVHNLPTATNLFSEASGLI